MSSLVSSLWQGGTHNGSKSWGGLSSHAGSFGKTGLSTVLFGTLAGAGGAALAKGNIWAGAATGFVVSFFNHLGGLIQKKIAFKKAVANVSELFNKLNPDSKPDFSEDGVNTLIDDVTGLRGAQQSAEPNVKIIQDKDMKYVGLTPYDGTIKINPSKIPTKAHLAVVLFHEFRHSWQYHSGLYFYWQDEYSITSSNLLLERDAYWYQTNEIGGGSYFEGQSRYIKYQRLTGHINAPYIPQKYSSTWKGF
jgi:hypothetical protein